MVIIELMTAIMGVVMGFLAFLLLGGLSGFFAWHFYPKARSFKKRPQQLAIVILLGFFVALVSSYIGQFAGIFQSGDMSEWFTAILTACLVSCVYCALTK